MVVNYHVHNLTSKKNAFLNKNVYIFSLCHFNIQTSTTLNRKNFHSICLFRFLPFNGSVLTNYGFMRFLPIWVSFNQLWVYEISASMGQLTPLGCIQKFARSVLPLCDVH